MKANQELYDEAQRLNDEESDWNTEREKLEAKVKELSKQLEELDTQHCVSEAVMAKQTKIAEQCKAECENNHVPTIQKLESENSELRKCLTDLEEEHEILLSRKEKAAGENMQLIMETQEFAKKKADLNHEVKEWKAKHKELERENGRLKIQLDMSMGPSKSNSEIKVR